MSEILSGPDAALPEVDERLVAPGSRYEIIEGKVVYVPPADEPHGTSHVTLAAMVRAHVGPAFSVAADMLTRTSRIDDIAPDVSVFPAARRPDGGRQLEHLAFEIASTQALSDVADKARRLVGRGVRRVFAIDLSRRRVLEWSPDGWVMLDLQASIVDPALAVPLPVRPLVDSALVEDATVAAFRARQHRAFAEERTLGRAEGREEGRAEGHAEGHAQGREQGRAEARREGLRQGIVDVLEARGLAPSPAQVARIQDELDIDQLERWHAEAKRGSVRFGVE